MNYGILKNALIEFIGDLRNRQKVEGFTNIQDLKIVTGEAGNFKLKPDFFKLNEEDIKVIKEATEETETKRHPLKTLSDRKMSFTSNVKADQKTSSLLSSIKTSSSAREEQILKLIEDKKDISINDIVSYFKGLSPKTIQRDLVSLVASGKIKKKGERRWSRYFI
jgi:predicted HTH transcriptional regulator